MNTSAFGRFVQVACFFMLGACAGPNLSRGAMLRAISAEAYPVGVWRMGQPAAIEFCVKNRGGADETVGIRSWPGWLNYQVLGREDETLFFGGCAGGISPEQLVSLPPREGRVCFSCQLDSLPLWPNRPVVVEVSLRLRLKEGGQEGPDVTVATQFVKWPEPADVSPR